MSGYIYFIRNRQNGLIKIGRNRRPKWRVTALTTECNAPMVLLFQFEVPGTKGDWFNTAAMCNFEAVAHVCAQDQHIYGEWFNLTPSDLGRVVARLMRHRFRSQPRWKWPRRPWLSVSRGPYRANPISRKGK